jgi:PHD/YefM family antitoxin component YafN of YafNO toxin-antitoxin module
MRRTSVAEEMAPAGEFRSRVAGLLEQLDEARRPIVVTQDGKPAAADSAEDADRIAYEEMVREKIREGLESLAREPTISPEEAKRRAFAAIARVTGQ